jgi:hypothetical protein
VYEDSGARGGAESLRTEGLVAYGGATSAFTLSAKLEQDLKLRTMA